MSVILVCSNGPTQRTSPISHVVQGAATSFGRRFVKNKQIEGSSPGGAALSPPKHSHRPRSLIFPGWREQTFWSTFSRRKCPVPPKSFPPMERTTTTSCRTAAPTSFRTGKTRCEGSAPSGKSSSVTSRLWLCAKTLPQTLSYMSAWSAATPTARRSMLRSLRLLPPRCPPRLSCHVSSPSLSLSLALPPSYVSRTAALNRSQLILFDAPPARLLARPF